MPKSATLTTGQKAISIYCTLALVGACCGIPALLLATQGSWVAIPAAALSVMAFFIPDVLFLPYAKRNIKHFRAAGFKPYQYWSAVAGSTAIFALTQFITISLFSLDAVPRWTVEAAVKTVLLVVVTDAAFVPAHRFMHRHMPSWHMLHHLCVEPSLSSNYFFDPIDLTIEFIMPVVLITVGSIAVKDPWLHVAATALQAAWYQLEHDPLLNLHHYEHHSACVSRYTAYLKIGSPHDSKDLVRAKVFEVMDKVRHEDEASNNSSMVSAQ